MPCCATLPGLRPRERCCRRTVSAAKLRVRPENSRRYDHRHSLRRRHRRPARGRDGRGRRRRRPDRPGRDRRRRTCPKAVCLGVGSQTFEGGPGNDIVFGERGNDILRGGEGNDRLYGGIGDDLLEGGPGNDVLSGGFGADAIDGGPGNDYVRGDGTQDEIVDTGPATDVDTLSYSTGTVPGFTRELAQRKPRLPGQRRRARRLPRLSRPTSPTTASP